MPELVAMTIRPAAPTPGPAAMCVSGGLRQNQISGAVAELIPSKTNDASGVRGSVGSPTKPRGATVAAGLALGVRSESAAEFSFLMSVAAIGGAAALSVGELGGVDRRTQATLGLGVLVALVSGVLALTLFVRLLRTGAFHRFAYYDVLVGGLFLAWLALR